MPATWRDRNARENFILFIAARYATNSEQRALFQSAFPNLRWLKMGMRFDVTAYEFAAHLVFACENYGAVEGGITAIERLRETIKASVGADKQAELDAYFIAPVSKTNSIPSPKESTMPETTSDTPSTNPPSVFLSYKQGDKDWNEKVLRFAARLSRDGFRVILDQTSSPYGGMSIPEWSDKQAREADFVLLACSPDYKAVADRTMPPGKGLGAAVELAAIRNRLYKDSQLNHKHLVVLLGDTKSDCIPDFLETFPYFNDGDSYDALTQRMAGVASVVLPTGSGLKVKPTRVADTDPT